MFQYCPLSSFEEGGQPYQGMEQRPSTEFLNRDGYGPTTPPRAASPQPSTSTGETQYGKVPSRRSSPRMGAYAGETQYDNFATNIEEDGLLHNQPGYRLYKRRFFGLFVLTLVNTTIASDGVNFAVISSSAAEYFSVSIDIINIIATASSLACLPMAPLVIWVINRYGVKHSILIAAALDIIGNRVRYAGTSTKNFPVVMFRSIIISMAQPFVLCAPTRFSKTWLSDQGRTSATALPSLTSFLGEAVASLLTPYLAEAVGLSKLTMYTAIISSVCSVPAIFISKAPPTPPSAAEAAPSLGIRDSLRLLPRMPPFYLQFISFTIFAGALSATTGLVNQILAPYGFSEKDAGLAAALTVFVGLAGAAVVSPILDHTKKHLLTLKIIVPVLASTFLVLAFVPQSKSLAAVYITFAALGALSFSVTPCTLEFQAAWTHPVPPEISSTICWAGANLSTAIFIQIIDAFGRQKQLDGQPHGSVFNGLIFQAVMTFLVIPCALLTGVGIFKRSPASKVYGSA